MAAVRPGMGLASRHGQRLLRPAAAVAGGGAKQRDKRTAATRILFAAAVMRKMQQMRWLRLPVRYGKKWRSGQWQANGIYGGKCYRGLIS
ncbi:hypothetical protein NPIL_109431 [Nephila pilipes]|uniref:Uncharacterized protein n=1 Tax=Nephila pilipes TaxID=299642 RepID=A0A8X6UC06_NEPPI|nr:hypothetical protein NPIL_109431 [Nephila pilipes]